MISDGCSRLAIIERAASDKKLAGADPPRTSSVDLTVLDKGLTGITLSYAARALGETLTELNGAGRAGEVEWRYAETLAAEQPMTNVPSFFRSIPFLVTRDMARASWLPRAAL